MAMEQNLVNMFAGDVKIQMAIKDKNLCEELFKIYQDCMNGVIKADWPTLFA